MKIQTETVYKIKETIAHKPTIKCLLRCGIIGCSSIYVAARIYTQLGIEWDSAWNTLQSRTAITFFHHDSDFSFWLFCCFCVSFSHFVFFSSIVVVADTWKANNKTRIVVVRIRSGDLGKNTIFYFLIMRLLHDDHGHGYTQSIA